ncbi:hypothetical protein TKK_0007897 [Trichogramma kaykai]|uniref:OBG-type G domain-containing protein n=1 Tax=Trichogramma kaykai TaxID=54128 RepID=A0ABD2X932_9HYME
MVRLTTILGYAKKVQKPLRKHLKSGYLDKLRFHVKAGTGGSGLAQYGGIGGNGGDVYVKAKEGLSLKELSQVVKKRELVAGTGYDSSKRGILGAAGEDLIINVPPGVDIYQDTGKYLGCVNQPDKKLIVAFGGKGGCKQTDYSGQNGESHHIILDLKLISDVALVGFPNAGKSTLLKTVSNAKPKVAAYPFTTLRPNLGQILYPDDREITMADLPGLIEGAHKNIGMGHNFLKHLERSKLLLFVVDIQGFKLSPRHTWRNCLDTILLLNKEIELYKPELLDIPAILLVNKMDTQGAGTIFERFKPKFENLKTALSEYPEDMCPEKVLEFEDILPMSLINKDKQEINYFKTVLRENLDKIFEMEALKLEQELPEQKLVEKLRNQLKLKAPVLV